MAATDPFAGVLSFVQVAEERSFVRAAGRLGVTSAAVSKAVRRLEEDLGVRLLERTSRHVTLTPEGEAFLDRAREAVVQARAAREAVAAAQRAPSGPLIVSLPYILGPVFLPRLARLQARHPDIVLHLRMSDRLAHLVEEQIDVALRVGELEDSSLVARRILSTRWVTLASPDYLARRGLPRTPGELAQHQCLKFVTPRGRPREWSFRTHPRGRETTTVRTRSTLDVDYGPALLDLAVAGAGICQALDFMLDTHLRDGRLVELLPDYAAEGPPVHAVYTRARQAAPRMRAVLQALLEASAARAPSPRGARGRA